MESPVVVVDPRGVISNHNPAFAKLCGAERAADFCGQSLEKVWQLPAASSPLIHALQHTDGLWRGEVHVQVDGRQLELLLVTKVAKRSPHESDEIIISITDIQALNESSRQLATHQKFTQSLLEATPVPVFYKDKEGRFLGANQAFHDFWGTQPDEINGRLTHEIWPNQHSLEVQEIDRKILHSGATHRREVEIREAGAQRLALVTKKPFTNNEGQILGIVGTILDITEQRAHRLALEERLTALTQPASQSPPRFDELFVIEEIQELQDALADSLGLASLITTTDGTPLTRPSNFCQLCDSIVRQTSLGRKNCERSDKQLGKYNPSGPRVQRCLSAGLWDAGAAIRVGGHHIANWLIGQARVAGESDEFIRNYAREMGADEEEAAQAYSKLPELDKASFQRHAYLLYVLAQQLSNAAYQNVQQARFIEERRLAANERRNLETYLQGIVDSMPSILIGVDEEGKITLWNQLAEQESGMQTQDAIGRPLLEVFPRLTNVTEAIEYVRSHSSPLTLPRQRLENPTRYEELTLFPVSVEGVEGVVLRADDVTERFLLDEKIIESEARNRTYIESSPIGVFLIDENHRFIDVNPAACLLTGYRHDELLKLTPQSLRSPGQIHSEWHIEKALSGAIISELATIRRRDGSDIEVDLKVIKISPKQIVAYCTDVSELLSSQERLKLFLTISEQANHGNAITDLHGDFVFVNKHFASLHGYLPQELIGRNFSILHPKQHLDMLQKGHSKVISEGRAGPDEVIHLRRDGTHFTSLLSAVLIEDYEGNPKYSAVSVTDISELKRAQQEKETLKSQLQQSQKMEAIGRLAGGVAHDFNNVLCAILGNISLAIESLKDNQEVLQILEDINTAAERAEALTKQLLAFSRKQLISPSHIDLNALLLTISPVLERLAGEDIIFNFELSLAPAFLFADSTQIEQVVLNLLINARDAMPHGGKLVIRTEIVEILQDHRQLNPGPHVKLEIEDTGVGMDAELIGHIFEPFFTTKERGRGTGLGLATVFGIVQQNEGHIEVSSSKGLGSTFTLFFPRSRRPEATQSPIKTKTQKAGQETILVVEDEDIVRNLARRLLTRQGYKVIDAASGPAALELLQRIDFPVDLLLTDVIMPIWTATP